MAFDSSLISRRLSIQDALDDLSSPRSSAGAKSRALQTLERHIAMACINNYNLDEKDAFFALQYTFECNVPLRLLAWIGLATAQLDVLTNGGTMDDIQEAEASIIATQLSLSLSLIQGVALNHPASKEFLGRKYGQEILLDLLLASRHYSTPPSASSDAVNKSATTPPLTSTVLDTLLCILVDSSTALRAFEGANGPQAVVKILKRAGTPREVRMKCLEFLYFYLLDETPTPEPDSSNTTTPTQPTPPPTAPATPIRPPKPYLSATPHRPTSRYGSSTYSFSSTASSSGSSSRSTSDSSMNSFSSTSSNASSSTNASSVSSSPEKMPTKGKASTISPVKHSQFTASNSNKCFSAPSTRTPPHSPPLPLAQRFPPLQPLQPRSMMMLKKDVDYVPLSPKKAQVSGGMRHTPKSKSVSGLSFSGSQGIVVSRSLSKLSSSGSGSEDGEARGKQRSVLPVRKEKDGGERRTTEEKKELLGTMLGNVDALVEGVRKAGIWGLG